MVFDSILYFRFQFQLRKTFKFFGLGFGLSEGGPLPSGVGGASSKAPACACSRPHHCGPFTAAQVVLDLSDLPTFSPSLSLSRPHLANDEAHALYHGYACSESTSASLRPKVLLPD